VIKRFFDFIISLIAIVLCAPVMMIIACLIQFRLGEPIFFIQSRLGMDGAPFSMIKFRTMRNDIDVQGALLSDNKRITKLGAFLRSSSLDELPELFNVLKGDMSLVGPRPLLMEYLSLYNDNQKKRQNVLPGITGWAQVNGRNAISWEEKFNLDVWYVENQSFWLDMKILWITIKKVIMREGISADGEATMPKFTGNKK
jgi:sugar transferase EpsL